MNRPRIEQARGSEIRDWIDAIAAVRILVFREWPYLYEGELDYERRYLAGYGDHPDSVALIALDGDTVVGVSTAMPLTAADAAFRKPFQERGWDEETVYYLGESVLQPEYRRMGIGHEFFDLREAGARDYGAAHTAFCAVERPRDHPYRPAYHRELSEFWRRRGYVRDPSLRCEFAWLDIGDEEETSKPLTFWVREMD